MSEIVETVSIDQLQGSDNYLKPTIGVQPNKIAPVDNSDAELKNLIQSVKTQISSIDYREIDFRYDGLDDTNLETYIIVLPDEIDDDVQKIIQKLIDLQRPEDIAQSWYFQIDSKGEKGFNRLHFNNGLPYELRGTGFGFKIYKSFITIKGYASSAADSTDAARRVWIKMVQESDFECVITDKVLLIVNKKLHNKLTIAKEFIEFYEIHLNSSRTVISETLLEEIKPYIPAILGGGSHEQYNKVIIPQANTGLKIGENVFVFNVDAEVITNNEPLAQKLGATNWKKGVNNLQDYDAVIIKNIIFNQGENVALCYSPRTKEEYLINVEGLEKEHEPETEMNK